MWKKSFLIIGIIFLFLINFVFAFNFEGTDFGFNTNEVTSNISSFLDLTDTPADYTGAGGTCVKVTAAEDGLEFTACAGGGDFSHSDFQTSFDANISEHEADWESTYNTSYLTKENSSLTYVPYVGATSDVDMGEYNITMAMINLTSDYGSTRIDGRGYIIASDGETGFFSDDEQNWISFDVSRNAYAEMVVTCWNSTDGLCRFIDSIATDVNLTVGGNWISNGTDWFSFQDLNTTGSGTSGGDFYHSQYQDAFNANLTNSIVYNNVSYLTTYNATYDSSIYNDSFIQTYNETYHGIIANSSINHTGVVYDEWGNYFYNQTYPINDTILTVNENKLTLVISWFVERFADFGVVVGLINGNKTEIYGAISGNTSEYYGALTGNYSAITESAEANYSDIHGSITANRSAIESDVYGSISGNTSEYYGALTGNASEVYGAMNANDSTIRGEYASADIGNKTEIYTAANANYSVIRTETFGADEGNFSTTVDMIQRNLTEVYNKTSNINAIGYNITASYIFSTYLGSVVNYITDLFVTNAVAINLNVTNQTYINNITINGNITASAYLGCTALETDANGNLVCGEDDTGEGGSGDFVTADFQEAFFNNLTEFTPVFNSTYNSTYDTWLPNYTASSKYWYNQTYGVNDTQAVVNDGIFTILQSWLFKLFFHKETINTALTQNITTLNSSTFVSFVNKTGTQIDFQNYNLTNFNRTCYNSDCTSYIQHNGSGIRIVG